MGTTLLVASLVAGSAAIAMWIHVRFASAGPSDWRVVLAHIGASGLVLHAALPAGIGAVAGAGETGAVLAVVGVVLPAFTYAFLAAVWMLVLLQRMMHGAAR